MALRSIAAKSSPEADLRRFVSRLGPADQKLFRSVRTAVRKRLPTATELAYDYTRNVVVSYSPTENGIDGIVAISARTGDMRLYLGQGKKLPDPKKLLEGKATQARFIRVEAASRLAHPDVEALIVAAISRARVPLPTKGRGTLVIRTDSEKKKPRGRAAK
jgi:hypothetical protein